MNDIDERMMNYFKSTDLRVNKKYNKQKEPTYQTIITPNYYINPHNNDLNDKFYPYNPELTYNPELKTIMTQNNDFFNKKATKQKNIPKKQNQLLNNKYQQRIQPQYLQHQQHHQRIQPQYIQPQYIQHQRIQPQYIQPQYLQYQRIQPQYIQPQYQYLQHQQPYYLQPKYQRPYQYLQHQQPKYQQQNKIPTLHEKCLEYGYVEGGPKIVNNTRQKIPTLDKVCKENGYFKPSPKLNSNNSSGELFGGSKSLRSKNSKKTKSMKPTKFKKPKKTIK
jgi:hypothetical protein